MRCCEFITLLGGLTAAWPRRRGWAIARVIRRRAAAGLFTSRVRRASGTQLSPVRLDYPTAIRAGP